MRLSAAKRKRLQEIGNELQEIVGGCLHDDGHPMTFAELEEECIEAGDLVTAAMLEQRVKQRKTSQVAHRCPMCQQEGTPDIQEEARVLQTDRGQVEWLEPAYYCRSCRRSFFPSFG